MLTQVRRVFLVRVHLGDYLSKPALGSYPVRFGGVPDVHAPEVGPAGVGVADALHDGDAALVVEFLDRGEVRVEAQIVVQRQDFLLRYAYDRPGVVVDVVSVGNQRVHKVVAAG